MKLEFSRQIFEKSSNIKFYENPSSGSRVVPWWQTDGWIGITKLIVTLRNSANAPRNQKWISKYTRALSISLICLEFTWFQSRYVFYVNSANTNSKYLHLSVFSLKLSVLCYLCSNINSSHLMNWKSRSTNTSKRHNCLPTHKLSNLFPESFTVCFSNVETGPTIQHSTAACELLSDVVLWLQE